ncbi:hypothetical protein K144316041_p10270 (plasmid) [Clostridium tetani]|uniref:hypothetical protein n=1 Tax=Clostridium tetani TaxID=1513 RepID=UPI00100A54EC|nr:hypothetical protein [Clostridium tetani]RXI49154.1 hypothetical protein DP124_13540 [Clostridium tetani]RXI57320.1 hypothetical protein DP122_00150 [Clostridium tetani]RXM72398.1 hypothetical protein DP139_01405 [Clostridium tetani]RXM73615.1 hypothetical protein DP143_04455 [Clostridium tetani]BDR74099.1 hypothetical protein K144316041_p10270 [Clostridium tetani]
MFKFSKWKKNLVIGCVVTFSVSCLPIQAFASGTMDNKNINIKNKQKEFSKDEGIKSEFHILNSNSEKIDIKIEETKNCIFVTSSLNGSILSRTIRDKKNGNLNTTFKDGRIQKTNVSDFISEELDDEITSNKNNLYRAPAGYNQIAKDYNSGVGQWGYLYGKKNVTQGTTYSLNFGAGTAISVIVGALYGLVTGGTAIAVILSSLGTTIVAETISAPINGQVWGEFINWKYEVYSLGQLGLRTEKKIVYARTVNKKTGTYDRVYLRTEGDTRSYSDLCKTGAYLVYINNL